VLGELSDDDFQAKGLHAKMCSLETSILAMMWNDILQRVQESNINLQNPRIDINTSIALLKSLQAFINSKRNDANYEEEGAKLCGNDTYEKKRKRYRNSRLTPLDYGKTPGVDLPASERFRTETFIPVIDQFVVSLTERIAPYEEKNKFKGIDRKIIKIS